MGFEKICEAARTFNQPILDMLLKEATYIDEWKPWTWFHSAVTQMALENRKNSVDFLLNKYDANINLAAKGAILGSAEHPELLNLVEELLAKGANPNLLACFAIQAGQIDYAESMEARFNININFLAEGAGLANNADYWKKCEARGAHMSYFYSGKAKAGHLTVQEILSLDPTAFNLDLILAVFCFENQKNQIDKLFRNHINPTNIAFAAVLYGDLPYALSLTKDIFSEQLMRIASMVGRWDYVKTGKDRIKNRGDTQKQQFYKFYLMGMQRVDMQEF